MIESANDALGLFGLGVIFGCISYIVYVWVAELWIRWKARKETTAKLAAWNEQIDKARAEYRLRQETNDDFMDWYCGREGAP